jgi:ribonuclease Z
VFGLPGLLSTLGLLEYSRTLTVVAPAGLREALEAFVKPTSSHGRPYPIDFVALEPGFERAIVRETPAYHVVARPLEHSLFTVGYRFEEKPRPGTLDVERAHALGVKKGTDFGRLKAGDSVKVLGWTVRPDDVLGPAHPGASFAYVTDTRPCAGGRRLAECADLVYHEATFRERDADRALETRHATAREAAEVARDAGARRLLIGHFSARYEAADLDGLLGEARAIFQNTEAADELKRYPIEAASRADSNLATD